jgi:hypothetical protein
MASMLAAALLAASVAQAPAPDCTVDAKAMLALTPAQFDQDLSGGWRTVANRMGCEAAAADLLAAYRKAHWGTLTPPELHINYFHEGQARAMAGQYDAAVPLLMDGVNPDASHGLVFPEYAIGTVAFLRGDLPALKAARARMVAMPRPDWFAQAAADAKAKVGMTLTWPMNLEVMDGLIRCFGRPYREAYGGCPSVPG